MFPRNTLLVGWLVVLKVSKGYNPKKGNSQVMFFYRFLHGANCIHFLFIAKQDNFYSIGPGSFIILAGQHLAFS